MKARLYYYWWKDLVCSHFHLAGFAVRFWNNIGISRMLHILKVCVAEIKGGRLATPERFLTPTAVLGVQRRHFGKFAARSR